MFMYKTLLSYTEIFSKLFMKYIHLNVLKIETVWMLKYLMFKYDKD